MLRPIEAGYDNELHDAAEHEDHTRQHPNVQEGDVRHAGNVVTDLNISSSLSDKHFPRTNYYRTEHGGQGEQSCHAHTNPTRYRLRWNEQ